MKWKESKWFQKIKSIKHLEYLVLGIFLCVVLLIFLPSGFNGLFSSAEGGTTEVFSLYEYAKREEARLDASLSKIAGAGEVHTLITYESGVEYVPAYSTDKTTSIGSDGIKNTTEKQQIIMSGGKPVIIKEIQPKVKGVVVVAEGAADARVKMELYQAVSTLLEVESSNIEIFAMSK